MRRLGRKRVHSDEEESVFVTMTDMTISFLLIIMILLAFFATQLHEDETVPLRIYESVRQERDSLRVENQALSRALNAVSVKLESVKGELISMTAERNRIRYEFDQLRSTLEALEAELARVKAERNQILEEIKRLRSEKKALKAEVVLLRSELDEITTDRDRLQKELDEVTAANEVLRKRISELEHEVKRLRRRLKWLKAFDPLEAYLAQAIDKRHQILVELKERLEFEFTGLQVSISHEQDTLRFQGEGLFDSGSSRFKPLQRQIVNTMGRLLDEILVCFTLGVRAQRGPDCDSGNALIEAVQIEGHTDSDGNIDNLSLSTKRAIATFKVMLGKDRAILTHENLRAQPVMSVSGYGEMRPIETNETNDGKAANRRIDLRIIMYAPSTAEEVKEVERRLDALRAAGGGQ